MEPPMPTRIIVVGMIQLAPCRLCEINFFKRVSFKISTAKNQYGCGSDNRHVQQRVKYGANDMCYAGNMPMRRRRDKAVIGEVREQIIGNCKQNARGPAPQGSG